METAYIIALLVCVSDAIPPTFKPQSYMYLAISVSTIIYCVNNIVKLFNYSRVLYGLILILSAF